MTHRTFLHVVSRLPCPAEYLCQMGDPKIIQEESLQIPDLLPSGSMCHSCGHKDNKMPHIATQALETHRNLDVHPSSTKHKLGDLDNTWLLCLSITKRGIKILWARGGWKEMMCVVKGFYCASCHYTYSIDGNLRYHQPYPQRLLNLMIFKAKCAVDSPRIMFPIINRKWSVP